MYAKWGFSNDVTENSNRLKKHKKSGWITEAVGRGLPQKEERRIRTELKRRGHELFPGTNEVFRITRELIDDAIGLGAVLPKDPYVLLKARQLGLNLRSD